MHPDGDSPRTKTATRDDLSSDGPGAHHGPEAHAETVLAGGPGGAAAPGDADRSGETLGRFRLLSRLGEGGMGVVYAAEDLRLGRTVALKILSPEAVHRDHRRRRFLREARAASAVMHPNIAAIFEVGEEAGEVFLAMERVAGQTLRATLRERATPFAPERALEIARDVAKGLREAHRADVVHRDLKPENVMITPDGQVKILDFGLAKQLVPADSASMPVGESKTGDLATMAGQIMGTAGYMSPEQALGEPVDTRTDLFSLGVILYELLTQTRPFQGDSRMAVLIATHRDPAAPPSARNPAVGPRVDALVMRCLAKRREERFQTADEVLAAIEDALRAPDESPARAAAPAKPSIGVRTSMLVVAILGLGAALGAAVLRKPSANPVTPADGLAGSSVPVASSAPASGTAATALSGTPPAVSGAETSTGDSPPPKAPVVLRRPCLAGEPGAAACGSRRAVAWCDPAGRSVGCCGKGLVPKGADGICVCPPGGTDVAEARQRGCEAPSPEWKDAFRKTKMSAMEAAIACFKPLAGRKSTSEGTFEAEFFLTPEGDVFDARVHLSTIPDDEGQACALAALRASRFPPPPAEEAGQSLGFGFVFNR